MILLVFNMYQTLFLAVISVSIGGILRKKIGFLIRFCVPAPVIGGLLFAIITCILHVSHFAEVTFDDTLREVCMVIFFTSVGFQANIRVLRQGGRSMVLFLILVIALIALQNVMAISLSSLLGIDRLLGLCTGSIPMVGGHGTAGAFGPVLEDFGVRGATTICTSAATFGLIAGSLMGGPLGNHLIRKYNLHTTDEVDEMADKANNSAMDAIIKYPPAVYLLISAAGVGTLISSLLSKTGMVFPIYIGAMLAAAVIRNYCELTGSFSLPMSEIENFGEICLTLFLGIAMITLKIWQLADLALPLIVLLGGQVVLMYIYTRFILFNAMGRNYDAAVIVGGTCGFGMGATPNAMANMAVITEQYGPSVEAYLLIPIVGSLFADFINSLAITFFINLL